MAELADEVRAVVRALLENMRAIAEKHPGELVGTGEFKEVLGLAKKAFQESETIRSMNPLGPKAKAAELVARLAALEGAISSSRPTRA